MATSATQEIKVFAGLYRPLDTPISFLNDDLMPVYTQALLLNEDIILTGDLNCDVLPENHNSEGRGPIVLFYRCQYNSAD